MVNGLGSDSKLILKDPEIKQMVINQLDRASALNKLDKIEYIKDVIIISEPFSHLNGMLTDSKKIKRPEIRVKYGSLLNETYENNATKRVIYD